MDKIVQYIIVRGDLSTVLNWPLGAVISQCCHATTAVTHLYHNDLTTQEYFADLDIMHKVCLKADDEAALRSLDELLTENDIKHKMWIEMPENIPTCIAIKPYVKNDVHKFVKKLKLFS